MEAIDEFANENIVRSIAFTALEKISTGQYQELLPIASQSLRQRARFLQENWYQWQKDTSLRMIEELVSLPDFTDQLYQRPVYYNRMDADTLYAIVEFAERDTQHFVVILLLEEGNSDISDIKYHNIKEMTEQEWLDVFENWSRSLEEAERIYLTKVARPKKVLASEIHNVKYKERERERAMAKYDNRNIHRMITGVNGPLMKKDRVNLKMWSSKKERKNQKTLKMSIIRDGVKILAR